MQEEGKSEKGEVRSKKGKNRTLFFASLLLLTSHISHLPSYFSLFTSSEKGSE